MTRQTGRARDPDQANPQAGVAVDASGGPVVDPTQNVLDLVNAAVQRLDDLSRSELASLRREADLRMDGLRREAELRADYDEKLRRAEASRIDAIRAVDVGAVNRAAEVAATQAGALAAQLIATAEASRVQVAAAASASVTSLAAALEPIQKDIRDLRDAQSRGQGGKEQVVEQRDTRGETRLNIGAILGGISVLLVLVFGVISIVLSLNR